MARFDDECMCHKVNNQNIIIISFAWMKSNVINFYAILFCFEMEQI